MMLEGELERIDSKNVGEVICCPGGLEVQHKDFRCDISPVLKWRKEMLGSGMEGFILHREGEPTGFIEYMPVENAPYPIEGENLGVIMCFHCASKDDEHHTVEKGLLRAALEEMKNKYEGATALAWDHQIHFPIKMFEDVGFSEVSSQDYISLMWIPFDSTGKKPELLGPNFEPEDLSEEGELAVELGYSNRCPYSINDHEKMKDAVRELEDDRIVFRPHRIDTKEEAVEFSKHAWNWNWLFLNGEEIEHMRKSKEELKEILKIELEKLD